MVQPPQQRTNGARRAERDAKIFALKVAGVPEREIGREVGLAQSRVNAIIHTEIARRIGPVAEEYADHREAELVGLWRTAYREAVNAKTTADRLKSVETCRRINESRRRLRGADAPEALEITHSANIELSSEVTVGAVRAALDSISLPPDRLAHALDVAGVFLEATASGEPFTAPAPMSSGITAAPYIDNGAMFIDGPGGMRYRVVATERQPGETLDRPALPPARMPDEGEADPDVILHEIEVIEAEYADLLEEVEDDDGPEGDQEASA
ncbi:hypothetical protein AB0H69_00305 [Streptomyces phaeochromogenes]|uniref:hypothetical protein n=1 Tax=Streptomyces phaeochromogenes TaxID=1923 RepID=UPI0033F0350A